MTKMNASTANPEARTIQVWLDDHGLRLSTSTGAGEPLDLASLEHGHGVVAELQHADGTRVADLVVLRVAVMTHTEAIRRAPQSAADRDLLILGPHVTGRGASTLRAAGIHHVDGAGNAWIRLPGVVVDVRGNAPSELIDRWVAAFPTGLGSPSGTRAHHAETLRMRATETGVVPVSGEAAAPGLRGVSAIVYRDDATMRLAVRNRWRTDREPTCSCAACSGRSPGRTLPRSSSTPTSYGDGRRSTWTTWRSRSRSSRGGRGPGTRLAPDGSSTR